MFAWQIILYTLSVSMAYIVLSMGFGFTLRGTKFFNLSFGGSFLIGGYMMFYLYRILQINFILSIIVSIILSGLYLALAYKFIFSPMLERRARTLVCVIASFGLLTLTSAVLGMVFGNQSILLARSLSDVSTISVFGATLNLVQVSSFILVPLIIALLALMRFKTRFGWAMRAVEDDVEVAELVGINKKRMFFYIFFLSGAMAGLVGIAEGFDLGIIPASGLVYLLPTIVAAVVGGMWSFWGGILGAFILAVTQQVTIVFFGGTWVQAVPFVILIIVLFIRPEGILKR